MFEIGVIPGLLQTPAYASELADSAVKRGAITAEQAQERVRDSKNPGGPVLGFPAAAFASFAAGVKAGAFDTA